MKETTKNFIVPWVDGLDLGSQILEVGLGYGAATEILRTRARELTCIEIDPKLAQALHGRILDGHVRVICGDATQMAFDAESFDRAVCFTMLHHISSTSLQDRLLQQIARALRRGGIFAGTDSLYSKSFRLLHCFDTGVVVSPDTLLLDWSPLVLKQ